MKYLKKYNESISKDLISKEVAEDIYDILLELSDNGYTFVIEYKIDDYGWSNTYNNSDELKSIRVEFSSFGSKQPYGNADVYLSDRDKFDRSKSEYTKLLKITINHLLDYVEDTEYGINMYHNDMPGRKKVSVPSDFNNIDDFIDFFIIEGGNIDLFIFNN